MALPALAAVRINVKLKRAVSHRLRLHRYLDQSALVRSSDGDLDLFNGLNLDQGLILLGATAYSELIPGIGQLFWRGGSPLQNHAVL